MGVLTPQNRADELEGADAPSLQDAFAKFRRGRRKTKPTVPASELKVRAAARRAADPAGDKARLRKKFIEKLKTYVGVPYAERYHKPGDALHGRPLYLDCCGLIRRAAQEMRADFGFDLGHWNQAYQFATCPTAREFPATVEPGDLLFVKGTYFKGRKKPQKGDVVHVEVFLGSEFGAGPKSTLSSRDHYGCVEIHDSFEYDSPWYAITALEWRSLDDWLEGRCDPVAMPGCFADHDPYGDAALRLGKKSIFDEAADGDDESDDGDGAAALAADAA
ncbi:hypothetical protein SO694_00002827 [Aureococcus anophagefferens]|uniref:NlpC/P60 domain-containing protein n=1 Tax=Aureococcus anophagefferens TaxID=44056 RepID=A0ABR1GCL8_AURAN|nr:hypothetical protein JL721_3809 [Aureococcus anophagefferens]